MHIDLTIKTNGTKLIQTFRTQDCYIYLNDSSGTMIDYDDADGYSLNSLLSYNFTANVQYKIRVKFWRLLSLGI
jgi:hypothetical protein